MEQLIYTLLAYINNSLKEDINYQTAQNLLKHIDQLEGFSLESAAEACHISPSTLNRFCKKIGFQNFSSLRNSFSFAKEVSLNDIQDTASSTSLFLKQLNENAEMIDNIPAAQMNWVAEQMQKSRKISILGFEKHQVQAMELQKKLFLLGKLCECGTNLFKQLEALEDLTKDDMMIMISIQGNILSSESPYFEKIKAAKGKKLLITFSDQLGELGIFDEILQCGKIENSAVSRYTLLRLFDVLVTPLQQRGFS